MKDHTTESIGAFLNATSERIPAPGGGAVAALTGALGACLSRMVVAYSVGKNTAPEVRAVMETAAGKLHRGDELLRALIAQDATAYEAMTAARHRVQTDPECAGDYQAAVLRAIAVPMEIAGVCSHVLRVLHDIQGMAGRYMLSDLGASAVIAHAGAEAARFMVLVNLSELDSSELRGRLTVEIDDTVRHCHDHRVAIEQFVRAALEAV